MSIKFVKPESSEQWDEYVLNLPNYSFVLSSAKYEHWENSSNQVFRYLIFSDEKFVGIVEGLINKVKVFGKYIECKHNPMLVEDIDSPQKEEILIETLRKLQSIATKNNCFFIRVSPLIEYDEIYDKVLVQFQAREAPIQPRDALISQYFDTTKDIDKLHSEMNKSSRSNVNKLLKDNDITVKVFKDDSVFDVFEDFYKQTKEYKGYRGKSADSLLKELRNFLQKDMLYFLVAYNKSEPVTVWQMVRYGKYMHHYQAGSNLKFNEKCTRLLFYKALELCKEIGVETLDLFGGMLPEGLEDKNNPWSGVNDFKMSLGGKKVTYMHPRDIPIKQYYNIFYPYAKFRVERKGHTTDW
jgi:lipid II:glycine glycyltransferase (peptidoglycan interpeptide bridge formation enzyme)